MSARGGHSMQQIPDTKHKKQFVVLVWTYQEFNKVNILNE